MGMGLFPQWENHVGFAGFLEPRVTTPALSKHKLA